MKKRKVTPTSFAFLDIMFCGFGAVVLLVMILNGKVLAKREKQSNYLSQELKRIELQEDVSKKYLNKLFKEIYSTELQHGNLKIKLLKEDEIELPLYIKGSNACFTKVSCVKSSPK